MKIILIILFIFCYSLSKTQQNEYVARQWNVEDGLPQSSIRCITQTHDGYLWLGTWNGLARFDGVHMTVFNVVNTPALHPSITFIHEDSSNRLWIGTDGGGLCWYINGKVIRIDSTTGFTGTIIKAMAEDYAGRMWFGTEEGIVIFDNGIFKLIPYGHGLPDKMVTGILPRSDGTVYLELVDEVVHIELSGDSLSIVDTPFTTGGYRVDQDSLGTLWYGVNGKGLVERNSSIIRTDGRFAHVFPEQVFILRNQEKWVLTPTGPFVVTENTVMHLHFVDGIDLSNISSVFEDREGIIWLAVSGNGLIRLLPKKVQAITDNNGLEGNEVMCGTEDRDGRVWIGTWTGGLSIQKPGFMDSFLPVRHFVDGMTIISICQSADGAMWVGTWGQGLYKIVDGTVHRVLGNGLEKMTSIREVANDPDGSVWIAGVYGALWHVKNRTITLWNWKNGLTHAMANSLLVTKRGEVWMGTEGGGVARMIHGRISFLWKGDGLIDDFCHVAIEDESGAVWLISKRGMQRWKNGVLSGVTAQQGFDDDAAQFLQDDQGNYWIGGTHGIHRILGTDLNEAAEGRLATLSFLTIGKSDGMPEQECGGGNNQRSWKTHNGELWFSTTSGAVRIDPRTIGSNPVPPGVVIEQVQIDHEPVPLSTEIVLRPGQSRVEFDYTGINFSAPDQIRFEYTLDGFDKGWRTVGADRYAQYTNLDPGLYTFRVKAENNAGIWNEEGASVAILVLPPFYATWWFRGIAVFLFLTVGPAIYALRVRQLKGERERQAQFSRNLIQTQESERKRIASELHDSLGQNLLVIKNKLLMAEKERRDDRDLASMSELVSKTIEEMRVISHNLRPHQLDQLGVTKTIRALAKQIAESSGISLNMEIADIDRNLTPEEEINLFRIVQECCNNLVKHSGATKVDFYLARTESGIELILKDNGRGMDTNGKVSTTFGFGLSGMHERARTFGWQLSVDSLQDKGTTIHLIIPIRL